MATSYATLATRSSASPCDVVSTTAMRSPASTIARSVACSSGASGVVACDCVVLGPPADARRDRADHAGREPGGLEGRNGEIGRRRLAVGAGDADHRQLVRRIAVPPRGGTGQRRSRGGDHELRPRRPRAAAARRSRPPRLPRSAAGTKSWPSACCPGMATKSIARAEPGASRASRPSRRRWPDRPRRPPGRRDACRAACPPPRGARTSPSSRRRSGWPVIAEGRAPPAPSSRPSA